MIKAPTPEDDCGRGDSTNPAPCKPARSRRDLAVASAICLPAAVLLLLLLPVLQAPLQDFGYYGQVLSVPAPEFVLSDTRGRPFRLSMSRGRFVYLMFGYLGCERLCHSQALTLQMLSRRIESDRVEFLFVGMDPERDTPERIRSYFDTRSLNFRGLVARDLRQAQAIAADYHAYFTSVPVGDGRGYRIDHPGFIYLIDPRGDIRLLYSGVNLHLERMLEDLERLSGEFT